MASFKLIRELTEVIRDNGSKRLLLGLYSANDGDDSKAKKYIALSEQVRSSPDDPFVSNKRGITIRRGEVESIIKALQSADFDAEPDNKGLSPQEYAKLLPWG